MTAEELTVLMDMMGTMGYRQLGGDLGDHLGRLLSTAYGIGYEVGYLEGGNSALNDMGVK